jgi:hypothetical protein
MFFLVLFYGEKTCMQGCTVEEFTNRVDSQCMTNGWDQQAMVARARGYMRDAAHVWCE